jgi:hypothetical protein
MRTPPWKCRAIIPTAEGFPLLAAWTEVHEHGRCPNERAGTVMSRAELDVVHEVGSLDALAELLA